MAEKEVVVLAAGIVWPHLQESRPQADACGGALVAQATMFEQCCACLAVVHGSADAQARLYPMVRSVPGLVRG